MFSEWLIKLRIEDQEDEWSAEIDYHDGLRYPYIQALLGSASIMQWPHLMIR